MILLMEESSESKGEAIVRAGRRGAALRLVLWLALFLLGAWLLLRFPRAAWSEAAFATIIVGVTAFEVGRVVWGAHRLARGFRESNLRLNLRCPKCGYDCAKIPPGAPCPECGAPVHAAAMLRREASPRA